MSRKVWRYVAAVALILCVMALLAVLTRFGAQPPTARALAVGTGSQSPAATIVVDSLADTTGTCSTTGASPCTLRDAITYANATSGADTITFSVSGLITLTATLPAIDDDVTLDGSGQTITVSGASLYRVLTINSGKHVTINALTIANGQCNFCGGGIDNSGTLTVTDSIFSGNSAAGGGGIRNNGGTLTVVNSTFTGNSAPSSNGGGLDNISGLLTVTGSTFSGNSAPGGIGGGIGTSGGTLIVINSTFSGNSALIGGGGGGIGNSGGALIVTNSTFSGNSASGGGGIDSFGGGATIRNTLVANSPSGGDCGGSVAADSHNLADDATCGSATHATAAQINLGPLANNGGSTLTLALNPTSVAINAGDNTVCPPTDQRGVARPQGPRCDVGAFELVYTPTQTGPTFVVNHTADTDDGACDALGSGIGNQDCTLREAINAANARGGANTITFSVSGTITLASTLPAINTDVTIDGSGHIITVSGNHAVRVMIVNSGKHVTVNALTIANGKCDGINCSDGAGIDNSGTLTVTTSTFSGNSANIDGGGIDNSGTLTVMDSTFSGNSANSNGGGIANFGMLNVTNSTFSDNSSSNLGGGIDNFGMLNVTNSTFSGNSALQGGGIYGGGSLTTFRNTLVANNPGGDCYFITADSHNLADDNTCDQATQKTSAQINLGPLANNGGATQTFALKYPSAAIDAGDDAVCPATDQRGVARPQGPHCDVGAYESQEKIVVLPLIASCAFNSLMVCR